MQASEDTSTHRPIMYRYYDNLDEVTATEQYDGDGVTITSTEGVPNPPPELDRRARTETSYDDQGRAYQSRTFDIVQYGANAGQVAPSDANPLPPLYTNTYYTHRGQVMAAAAPGGLWTKNTYDGAGRTSVTYTTDGLADIMANYTWAAASSPAGDNVLTQTQTTYDANGNPTLVTTKDRFHNETHTGPLGNATTAPLARVSYVASYYDAADRLTDEVNVGTNGGVAYTRPTMVPMRSDTVLVTSYGYLADTVQQVALSGNPSGTFTLTVTLQGTQYPTGAISVMATAAAVQSALNNALPPALNASVQVSGPAGGPWNVRFVGSLAGTPVAPMTGTASGFTVTVATTSEGGDTGWQEQVTDPRGLVQKTDYDLLGRTIRTLDAYQTGSPTNASDRETDYTYDGDGHTLSVTAVLPNNVTETTQYTYHVTIAQGSAIDSNDLLGAVTYPGQAQQELYTDNALGQTATMTDRNGTAHQYFYDVLGRQTSDQVTSLGMNVDGTVRRIDTAYDTGDRPYLYTSYANLAGTMIVNQVQQVYNGLSQLIQEYQSHGGAVTGSTPSVQYAYNEMGNGENNSRLVSMTYPNGREIDYTYASGVDDRISRLTSLQDHGAAFVLEQETYLGLDTVVQRSDTQTNVDLTQTYIAQTGDAPTGDAGDQYIGLDRFGRVVDQRWFYKNNPLDTTDRFQYGYDRDGNVLYRANVVTEEMSSPLPFDERYSYDNFNQLVSFGRGLLNASRTDWNGTPTHTQSWMLDPLGNWLQFTNDSNTPQARTNNVQNQITSISGTPTMPQYDPNGNTRRDDQGTQYVYDAWNRLVQVTHGGTTETYTVDALGRRVTTKVGSATPTDLYYSSLGRWMQEDPFGLRAGLNLYQYLLDNPPDNVDPFGLKAGEVKFNPVTIGDIVAHINATFSKDRAADIKADLSSSFMVDFTDEQAVKKIGGQKSLVKVYKTRDGKLVVGSFLDAVRFSADLNDEKGCSIIQDVTFNVTTNGGKPVTEHFVEGWVVDSKGNAAGPDLHGAFDQQLTVGVDKNLKFEMSFIVGVGTYDGKPITGERSQKSIKGVYDKFEGGDYKKIRWLGPERKYTVLFTLDVEGNWTLNDASTGVNRAGKFDDEKKK